MSGSTCRWRFLRRRRDSSHAGMGTLALARHVKRRYTIYTAKKTTRQFTVPRRINSSSSRSIRMAETNRRDFLAASAVGAAAVLAPAGVFAAADDVIKVGVIGTGGRGTGAAENCLNADKGVKIVAL